MTTTATPPTDTTTEPVDWALAARIARRFGGRDPLADTYLSSSLAADFSSATAEAEVLVSEFTGLRVDSTARATVLDRAGWIDANVTSMRGLLKPLTMRMAERAANNPFGAVGRSVSATQMGVVLGWLSQRVLGQYDLLVPEDGEGGSDVDAVYYVGSNILGLEKRFAFRPRDFRLWIAIHEVTHRAQFRGVPWLRGYFTGLVGEIVGSVDTDPRRLASALGHAVDELRHGRNPLDDGGIVALFATAEQRGVLARVQALMSVLEGHGNRVMNELGREHVAGQARMARVLHSRRQARGMNGILQKSLGFETKMRQYEVGERFVDAVEREGGPRAFDAAWRSPESLPTIDELHHASAWLARVA